MTNAKRPSRTEYGTFYQRYIDHVTEEDVVAALEAQARQTAALLGPLTEEQASYRYAPEKWSVKQIIGHVTDAERVFAYRTLAIARGETKSLPGFDEGVYVANANFDDLALAELLDNLAVTRGASVTMLRSLSEDAWARVGTANDSPISVRAVAHIMLGHERHHLGVLRERYLNR